ncbi:GNAT family N-acetyltransferase [Nostoc sp.]|uniref:GNAT family N-acetyltransferase n=1 Tax=Nostoc sp. TaxID=1180 RepID=UPI002FF60F55
MYSFTILEQDTAVNYEKLTYPYYQRLLQELTPEKLVIAIGVEFESEPIGLILATYWNSSNHSKIYAKILSLFVVPSYRCQGLGKALLGRMEIELQSRGCCEVSLSYVESPNSPTLEKILNQSNWTVPNATALICYASRVKLEQASQPHLIEYLEKLEKKLPPSYTIFFWRDLTAQEREAIESQIQTDTLVRQSNPFTEESKIEPLNSLGLRYQNKVIGWMITHRTAPDTIRYTQLFVEPDFQPLSRSILMLVKSILIHVEKATEATKATWQTDINNAQMVNFIYRRLAPYLDEIRKSFVSTKSFKA